MDTENLDDYVTSNESQKEKADIDAPIVFVGYGSRRRSTAGTTTRA